MTMKYNVARLSDRFFQQQQGYSVAHNGVSYGENQKGAVHPSNPSDATKLKRGKNIKVRLTEAEWNELLSPLKDNGKTGRGLSKLIRDRLFASSRRPASHPMHCKHCRLLAMAVNHLNLIARRVERMPQPEKVIEILAHLKSLEHEIQKQTDRKATE
jgi:hypothetical protein